MYSTYIPPMGKRGNTKKSSIHDSIEGSLHSPNGEGERILLLPANAAMPMFLASCETEMHVWKYG